MLSTFKAAITGTLLFVIASLSFAEDSFMKPVDCRNEPLTQLQKDQIAGCKARTRQFQDVMPNSWYVEQCIEIASRSSNPACNPFSSVDRPGHPKAASEVYREEKAEREWQQSRSGWKRFEASLSK